MPKPVNRGTKNLGMLDEHKAAIQRNYEVLVQSCDISRLIPKLLEKNVFSQDMLLKYKVGTDLEVKRTIFMQIPKRGPKAFENLIQSLKETNQQRLVNMLLSNDDNDNSIGTSSYSNGDNLHVDNYNEKSKLCQLPTYYDDANLRNIPHLSSHFDNINLQTKPLTVEVKHSVEFYDKDVHDTYATHSKNRGLVLIINNSKFINDIEPPRNGSEVDENNLTQLFTQMHMEVEPHKNLTMNEMNDVIKKFAKSPKLKHADMVFVFVMSHGRKSAHGCVVVCSDMGEVESEWIEQQFNNHNCPYMQKKPKILVFQVCRGEMKDYGTSWRVETDSAMVPAMRTLSDILVAHSTLPGYKSHRDVYLGTWYIQLICEAFMEHAHNKHIEDLFKIVDQKLERLRAEQKSMQTSSYLSQGFNKKCYLHPGIYLENDQVKKIL